MEGPQQNVERPCSTRTHNQEFKKISVQLGAPFFLLLHHLILLLLLLSPVSKENSLFFESFFFGN
jgi:hypothetical protein